VPVALMVMVEPFSVAALCGAVATRTWMLVEVEVAPVLSLARAVNV
jgi:hypothetical protein